MWDGEKLDIFIQALSVFETFHHLGYTFKVPYDHMIDSYFPLWLFDIG